MCNRNAQDTLNSLSTQAETFMSSSVTAAPSTFKTCLPQMLMMQMQQQHQVMMANDVGREQEPDSEQAAVCCVSSY